MAISILRSSPFSGLDELVAQSPGYHVAPNGKIYSDHCSLDDLKRLRRRIYKEFFGVGRIMGLTRKGVRSGFLRYLPIVLPYLPKMLWKVVTRTRARTRRRKKKQLEECVVRGGPAS
jgi:hypothetical protein